MGGLCLLIKNKLTNMATALHKTNNMKIIEINKDENLRLKQLADAKKDQNFLNNIIQSCNRMTVVKSKINQ